MTGAGCVHRDDAECTTCQTLRAVRGEVQRMMEEPASMAELQAARRLLAIIDGKRPQRTKGAN